MEIINKIFKVLSWIVVAAIIVYIMIAAPVIAGYRPVVVLSGSMEPTYPVGCVTYYRSCEFSRLQAGDVVTFKAGDSMVTHRIVKKNARSWSIETKGDNNPTQDPNPVYAKDVVGKTADFKIPFAGYFVIFGKKPAVIAAMILILLTDYVLERLTDKRKRRGKHETQKE